MLGANEPALRNEVIRARPVFGRAVHFRVNYENDGVSGWEGAAAVGGERDMGFAGAGAGSGCKEAEGFFDDGLGIGQGLRELGF